MKQGVHREAWRDGKRSFAEGRQGGGVRELGSDGEVKV